MDYNVTYREKDKGIQVIVSYKENNGKWKQKSKQGFEKKSDAKRGANKIIDELKEIYRLDLSNEYDDITFKEFTEIYLKSNELHLSHNSVLVTKSAFIKFNKLDKMLLKDIKYLHIQECIDDMIRAGYHSNTINHYLGRVSTLFKRAVKPYKIIAESPVEDILIPVNTKNESKIKALSKSDLDTLLKLITPYKDYMFTLLTASCGLRIGEIMGLTLDNIDLKGKTLDINKQWKKQTDGTYGFGKLKTKNSYRIVPLSDTTIKALKLFMKSSPTDLNKRLFIDSSNNTVSNRLSNKFKRVGYDISIHDLRHTYVTLLIAKRIDFKTISELIGDTVEMVTRVYGHVNDDMFDTAKKAINSMF